MNNFRTQKLAEYEKALNEVVTYEEFDTAIKKILDIILEARDADKTTLDARIKESESEKAKLLEDIRREMDRLSSEIKKSNTTTFETLKQRSLESINALFNRMRLEDRFNNKMQELDRKIADMPVIDKQEITRDVAEYLGKEGLSIDAIQDLRQTLDELREMKNKMAGAPSGPKTLWGLQDVDVGGITTNQSIKWDGVRWVAYTPSGGSGFSTLDATETPNGILTVFTFAAATAQPTYIVSDNVWMRATASTGAVNWTWDNGAKQATMIIPPSSLADGGDIWGVV